MLVSLLLEAPAPYMPYGYCYLWDAPLAFLHVVSDALVGLAFFSIPVALLWFVRKRRDVPFQGVLLWFSSFLVACGATHFLEVWNVWHDDYWPAAMMKAVAAITSGATTGYLLLLLPKLLKWPSPRQMEQANARLAEEVSNRERVMKQLQTLNEELESRVRGRTGELESILKDMRKEIEERRRAERERQEANERLTVLLTETEEKSRQSALIKQMSTLLQTCATTAEAFQVVHDFATRIFPPDSGALCLLNPSLALMETSAAWGAAPASRSTFGPEECWALRTGQVHTSGPEGMALQCGHVAPFPGGSYVCVPMVAHYEALGLLHVRSAPEEAEWPQAERARAQQQRLRLTMDFSADIALALANLRLRETLRTQSTRDALTGLFNRRYLTESLDREVRRADRNGRPLGVVMLDLDQFKPFNDSHGHEAGDALLRAFGRFIQKNTRGEDIACRYGGDEFVILLVDADLEVARRRAEELRDGFGKMVVRHMNHKLDAVSFSMGVAGFPVHGLTSEDLLAGADEALYEAKAEGRNRVRVYKEHA
ncbi:MAG TPA: GGDEF domain-containing protein [Candidatus Binatia bacterium]|nr:GGDEF domain-containing protein [Candidatus Binatia bacterium]